MLIKRLAATVLLTVFLLIAATPLIVAADDATAPQWECDLTCNGEVVHILDAVLGGDDVAYAVGFGGN